MDKENINSKSLEEGLKKAINSKTITNRVEKSNRDFAKSFRWELIAKQFDQEISRVIKQYNLNK